ncbi:MAG: GC-type dockerin domain-anchored protein [Phycisphaerales bacterium]
MRDGASKTCRGLWVSAVALVVAAPIVCAQDSVSTNGEGGNGLPGDALYPWSSGIPQRASYIVDTAPITTSWGTTFGLAPIAKSSLPGAGNTTRFTMLNGASSISQTIRRGRPFPSASYSLWTQAGGGVNTSRNNTALVSTVTPTGTASVFSIGFLDFCDVQILTNLGFINQVVGAQVAFDPANPTRFYVTRVLAANNSPAASQLDRSQFGYGGVDADGNIVFRADSTTALGTTNLIQGDNLFRVTLASRTTSTNSIDTAGASDTGASTRLLNNSSVTHATPNLIPSEIEGRSILLAADFARHYVFESAPNVLSTSSAHLAAAADHRGGITFSPTTFFMGTIGTGAALAQTTPNGSVNAIHVFGITSGGTPGTPTVFTLPGVLTDACDSLSWPLLGGSFRGYDSQVAFRGGSSQVAVGKDQFAQWLVAATVYRGSYTGAGGGTPANPFDAIAVGRLDVPGMQTSPDWSLAAWVRSDVLDGKVIRGDAGADGVFGTADAGEGDGLISALDAPIGRLASMSELAIGKAGPSISSPMFDSVGNIYFVASFVQKRVSGPSVVQDDFGIGLFRAVYNPATFCYALELVLREGTTVMGANSATPYRIAALGLADGDSIASNAPWANSISAGAWNAIPLGGLEPKDPQTLGGLVLSARILYDTDANGLFEDPTLPGGNAASVDQAYNVALLLANTTGAVACVADVDNGSGSGVPDGGVTIDDLLYYIDNFNAGDLSADVDDGSGLGIPDAGVTIDDLLYYLFRFGLGC